MLAKVKHKVVLKVTHKTEESYREGFWCTCLYPIHHHCKRELLIYTAFSYTTLVDIS